MIKQITTSVIICTRNRLQDVFTVLKSLQTQTVQSDELIIVDSSDKQLIDEPQFTSFFVQDNFPQSNLVYKHTQPGLTLQRNVGVSLASSDIVYFFDDDVILEPDYLEQMNIVFENNLTYGGGMGAVTNSSAVRTKPSFVIKCALFAQRMLRIIFLLQRDNSSGNFTWSGMPTHTYETNTFKEVEVLGGCCMAYRSEVFKKHLFDEKLTRYAFMEDCDFSRRVSRDCPLFYNPKARLQHLQSPLNRDAEVDNRAMYIKNYSYLFFKNEYPRNKLKLVAYCWSVIGLFVEGVLRLNKNYLKGYFCGLRDFYVEH